MHTGARSTGQVLQYSETSHPMWGVMTLAMLRKKWE